MMALDWVMTAVGLLVMALVAYELWRGSDD